MESLFSSFIGRRLPAPDVAKKATKGKQPATSSTESVLTRLTKVWEDRFLLLTPSPQELACRRVRALNEDPAWRTRQNEYKYRPPPLGFIRVAFYDDITKLYRDIEPDIESFVRLPPSGGLDLRKLRHQWGLETCAPIHPLKWKVEETADPDWMSPLAVHNNTDHRVRCITFTEPSVSQLTVYQRRLRAALLLLLYPVIHVPVPAWWSRLDDMPPQEYQEFMETVAGFLFFCGMTWAWYHGWFTFHSLAFWLRSVVWRLQSRFA